MQKWEELKRALNARHGNLGMQLSNMDPASEPYRRLMRRVEEIVHTKKLMADIESAEREEKHA